MIIFVVHTVTATEIRPVNYVTDKQQQAEEHAAELSTDTGTLAAQVTSLALGELGTRSRVALYVAGKRQKLPFVSDDRSVNGS